VQADFFTQAGSRLSVVGSGGQQPPRPGGGLRATSGRQGGRSGGRPGGNPVHQPGWQGQERVRARVAAVTDHCWQCRTKVRAIVGVLVDPARTPDGTGFIPFDEVAGVLADTLDTRALNARRIGEIRHRSSPGVAGGYIANGCVECDALLGRFMLEDLLSEHLHNGGTYGQLDMGIAVDLPLVQSGRLRALG
jgi:hypothetical protein